MAGTVSSALYVNHVHADSIFNNIDSICSVNEEVRRRLHSLPELSQPADGKAEVTPCSQPSQSTFSPTMCMRVLISFVTKQHNVPSHCL